MRSLNNTNVGETKFIKPNSQRQDRKSSNVYVSGQSTESKVDFNYRVDLVKLGFKRDFKELKIICNEWK